MGCYNTTVINASAERVWELLRDFHELSWAEGVVTSVERVGDAGATQVGAQRILNGAFHETLRSLDDAAMTLTYSIDDGPGPVARDLVNDYLGRIRVLPVTDTGGAFVEWESSYESADVAAVADFCNPIYRAALAALKAHFTTGR